MSASSFFGDCDLPFYHLIELAVNVCLNSSRLSSVDALVKARSSLSSRAAACQAPECVNLFALVESHAVDIISCDSTVGTSIALTATTVDVLSSYNCSFGSTPTLAPPTITPGASTFTILVSMLGGMVLMTVLCGLAKLYRKWHAPRRALAMTPKEEEEEPFRVLIHAPAPAEMTQHGPWKDPVITAVRIPLAAIQLGNVISQGGFGEVLRATYKGETVAVKRLLPGRRKDMANIRSFFEEVKLTATLDHQHIARFVGVAWTSLSDLCMVSEFVSGGDLRCLMAQYATSGRATGYESDKLKIGIQVAHALTYLHSLQPVVVHRDLKSRNILLAQDGDAKLIDFGVSCESRDLTMTAGVGSSLWMSPEIMMGERYNEKADVFSFGVVLSELDTHELPYAFAKEPDSDRPMNEMAVLQLVAQGRLTARFTDDANPLVVALAQRCLLRDADARPTAAELLFQLHTVWRSSSFFL